MQDRTKIADPQAMERPVSLQIATEVSLAVVFTIVMIVAAKVRIPLPFTPVPLTLQTMVVLAAGGLLGPRVGAVSALGYWLAGLLGLPVLALPYVLGPTGGYVIGFIFAAIIMGYCTRERTLPWLVAGAVGATVAIYLCGSLWLMGMTGQSFNHVLTVSAAPFLPGDAIKCAAAIMIIRTGRPYLSRLL